jgi:serine/threonine-protein kinase
LADGGSRAGTLVNCKRITEYELQPGDLIQIGDTKLRFVPAGVHEQGTLVAPPPTSPTAASPATDLSGQTISHYEVGPLIAKGRTSVIYKARDRNADRDVAFKVLRPETIGTEEAVQRFIRTVHTVVSLRHPNLVAVYGAGKTGSTCWVAMEYVDGESLTKVVERIGLVGMLDWRYALTVAVQVARALQAAHQEHIIHRNVTPENILIRKTDNAAKLGDLMLAKALEGALAKQLTRPGQLMGDLAYMAPERTREDAPVDTRSDIYGLGATVYALLTGRPPFEGSTLVEMMQKIRTAEPTKPKKYQLSIPDLFEGTVLRMLAKRPEDRFETPTELLNDLLRVAKFNGLSL